MVATVVPGVVVAFPGGVRFDVEAAWVADGTCANPAVGDEGVAVVGWAGNSVDAGAGAVGVI